MFISCKLSNTVLAYFDLVGLDASDLWSQYPMPEEYLRDASSWLTFAEMEHFLEVSVATMKSHPHLQLPLENIAEKVRELRSWGLLDHVLRILNQSNEPLAQPQRFLSYFIQTEDEGLCLLTGEPGTTACEFPLDAGSFPLTANFLCASLRSLSLFFDGIQAEAQWTANRLVWKMNPSSLKKDAQQEASPRREIDLSALAQQLEDAHTALQKQKTKRRQNKQEDLQTVLPGFDFERTPGLAPITSMSEGLQYLNDTLIKMGQLTRLIAMSDSNKQNKQILKNLDWDFVQQRSNQILSEMLALEQSRQRGIRNDENSEHSCS